MGLAQSLFCPAEKDILPLRTLHHLSKFSVNVDDDEDYFDMKMSMSSHFRNNFDVGHLIQKGSTSRVYSVVSKIDRSKYACKIVDKKYLSYINGDYDDASLYAMYTQLRKEIYLLQQLNHPNIVRLHDFSETERSLCITMQHIDGVDLFQYISENGPLSETDTKTVMYSVFSAVSYLHQRNIIHRDIKPENILLTNRSDPKAPLHVTLIDFGFSTSLSCMENSIIGTGGYMAPEILQGVSYGTEVDIWSCGVMIFVLIAKRLPFPIDVAATMAIQSSNESMNNIFELHFNPIYIWCKMSIELHHLVSICLELTSSSRITATEALKHPWFNDHIKHDEIIYNPNKYDNNNSISNITSSHKTLLKSRSLIALSYNNPRRICSTSKSKSGYSINKYCLTKSGDEIRSNSFCSYANSGRSIHSHTSNCSMCNLNSIIQV